MTETSSPVMGTWAARVSGLALALALAGAVAACSSQPAVSGAHGKVRQRQIIARDSVYVAGLIRTVPASSPPAVAASPGQTTAAAPSGPATLTAPSSRPPGHTALSLAALIAWLVTVGLGVSMMARWITSGLAWVACGLVLAVASLGMALVFLTVTTSASTEDDPPPAGRPPVLVIAAHITTAVVTILLVTLAASGAG
jgi:hypothetical protein